MKLAVLGLFLFFADQGLAQSMAPVEVYTRCHLQLTGMLPVQTDSTYKSVLAGTTTPEVGCQRIFELGRFAANGVMKNRTNAIARRVVERVHNIHINWFQQKYPTGVSGFTNMVVDMEEPALYLTRAAFLENEKFSSIVTLNSGLKGYRQALNGTAMTTMERKRFFNVPEALQLSVQPHEFKLAFYPWSPTAVARAATPSTINVPDSQLTQFGVLQGVIPSTPIALSNQHILHQSARYPLARADLKSRAQAFQSHVNGHFGGGLIGSQAFTLINTNLVLNQVTEEETIIHRRLAARIYENLLCHQLPTLTASDVNSQVIPTSPHTFRKSSSCMRCHASMDPTAYTFKNLSIGRTIAGNQNDNMYGYHVDTVYQAPLLRHPNYYSTQDPKGNYDYRTLLDRKRMTGSVNNITQLGSHLASAPDLYLCASKKYYKYFMGVDVQLQDREVAGTKFAIHQNNVIKLAQKLQSTQSVSTALKDLFALPEYQSRDFGSTNEEAP